MKPERCPSTNPYDSHLQCTRWAGHELGDEEYAGQHVFGGIAWMDEVDPIPSFGDWRVVNAAECGHHPPHASLWCLERFDEYPVREGEKFPASQHDAFDVDGKPGIWYYKHIFHLDELEALSNVLERAVLRARA